MLRKLEKRGGRLRKVSTFHIMGAARPCVAKGSTMLDGEGESDSYEEGSCSSKMSITGTRAAHNETIIKGTKEAHDETSFRHERQDRRATLLVPRGLVQKMRA
jgi:hypothetical protein